MCVRYFEFEWCPTSLTLFVRTYGDYVSASPLSISFRFLRFFYVASQKTRRGYFVILTSRHFDHLSFLSSHPRTHCKFLITFQCKCKRDCILGRRDAGSAAIEFLGVGGTPSFLRISLARGRCSFFARFLCTLNFRVA